MRSWNIPSEEVPAEGQVVDVRLIGGRFVEAVEFSKGRFWKVRRARGGQAYAVEAWRSREIPKRVKEDKGAVDGNAESTD